MNRKSYGPFSVFLGIGLLIFVGLTFLLIFRKVNAPDNYTRLRTKVYIEEEHHEVIPHWVNVLKAYGWKKAVLIHIDAHSDMDYPFLVPEFPLGHPPESEKQIQTMMQRNDQFIQSAIIGQLLKTVYLIFPSWTSNTSSAVESFLGITNIYSYPQVCLCYTDENKSCFTRTPNESIIDLVIQEKDCEKLWPFEQIELTSKNAANTLKWSKKYALSTVTSSPIILDIDEDFFGVHLVSQNLLQTGISLDSILSLQKVIQTMFCIKDKPEDELQVDAWFHNHLTEILQYCSPIYAYSVEPFNNRTLDNPCQFAIIRSKQSLFSNHISLICPHYFRVNEAFDLLTLLTTNLTFYQIQSLRVVGLCLENAWRTYAYTPVMTLCLGHNYPTNNVVQEFVPKFDALAKLVQNFTKIIRAFPRSPDVITIARSSRDGYVDRKLQPTIELVILKVLKMLFHLEDNDFHFSKYLAGGKGGWWNRLKHSNNK